MVTVSQKALKYAEDTLGVHEVFTEVVDELTKVDTLTTDLDKALDQKRYLADAYEDRYVALIGEMRGVHPSMSDTGFKTRLREWEREDAGLASLRAQQNTNAGEIQGLEFDIDMCKMRIRIGTARMEELGGYLHYLAAVKQAETLTKGTGDAT